jgi:hypothetical protein
MFNVYPPQRYAKDGFLMAFYRLIYNLFLILDSPKMFALNRPSVVRAGSGTIET